MAGSQYSASQNSQQDLAEKKWTYNAGRLLLALSFLINGLTGLMQSRAAKVEFHRSHYIVTERLFGGVDLNPTNQRLEESFVYFNFVYHLVKILMIALSFAII